MEATNTAGDNPPTFPDQPAEVAEKTPGRTGPPDRPEADFFDIRDPRYRREAIKEYRRTLNEFRETGAVAEKTWRDFARFAHPLGCQSIVYTAHHDACRDIEQWNDEQGFNLDPAAEPKGEPAEQSLSDQTPAEIAPAEFAPAEEEPPEDAPPVLAPLPEATVPLAEPARPALLRGVEFDPDAPGRIYRYQPKVPQLDLAPLPEALPPADDTTESLLNAMIGECHFLMRAVTYPSMCHARVAEDRMAWIDTAVKLAGMGAKVGKSIAHLRHGPAVRETRHTTTIVQNAAVAEVGGGG